MWEKALKLAAEEVFFRKWDTSLSVCVCGSFVLRGGETEVRGMFSFQAWGGEGWRLAGWSFRRFGGGGLIEKLLGQKEKKSFVALYPSIEKHFQLYKTFLSFRAYLKEPQTLFA